MQGQPRCQPRACGARAAASTEAPRVQAGDAWHCDVQSQPRACGARAAAWACARWRRDTRALRIRSSAPQPGAGQHVGSAQQRRRRCWHGGALALGEAHEHCGGTQCTTTECTQARRWGTAAADALWARGRARWKRDARARRRRTVPHSRVCTGTPAGAGSGGGAAVTDVLSRAAQVALHGRVHACTSAVDDSGKPLSRTCSRWRRRARARRCRMTRRARDSHSRNGDAVASIDAPRAQAGEASTMLALEDG